MVSFIPNLSPGIKTLLMSGFIARKKMVMDNEISRFEFAGKMFEILIIVYIFFLNLEMINDIQARMISRRANLCI